MKNTLALVALAAGLSQVAATGYGFHNAPSYTCPDNSDNQCTPDMTKGFDWSDLNIGNFDSYKGFTYTGYQCSQKFGKRDALTGRSFQSKCITGKATNDKNNSPKISCDQSQVKKTSIREFQVTPDFDCDLEFHYTMPDGSSCKHRSSCKASGTVVQNTQCGGATDVTVVYPHQPDKSQDSCNYGIHSIGFDCEGPKPTKEHTYPVNTPTYPVNTPGYPVSTPSSSASTSSAVVSTPSYPAGSPSSPTSTPVSTPSVPATSSVPFTYPSYSVSTPAQSTPAESTPASSTPAESTPASSTPAESTPASSTPAESTPAQSTPAESTPAQSTPAESTPASSTPVESTPAQSSTIGSSSTAAVSSPSVTPPSSVSVPGSYPVYTPSTTSVPVESTPAQSTPAESTPASSTPASSTPASSTPASSTPAESTPASSTPAQSTPVVTTPIGSSSTGAVSTPADSTPAQSTPAESTPASSTPAQSTPVVSTPIGSSSTGAVSTPAVTPSYSVTSYITTSTVFSTSVHTITSCGPDVPNCPAGSTSVTTVIIPVSTTVCPVTETLSQPSGTPTPTPVGTGSYPVSSPVGSTPVASSSTSPVSQTSSTPSYPVETLPCPGVVPSCLNTWMFNVGCKDNTDSACYCPDSTFVNNVFACLYAHGESDEVISEAVSYFQGICAPFVPSNPGIATGAETITSVLTVTPTPAPAASYTTIQVVATTVVPCTDSVGQVIPSSSSTVIVSTAMTVPQVIFTTITATGAGAGSSSVAVIPGTYPAFTPTSTPGGVAPPYPTGPAITTFTTSPSAGFPATTATTTPAIATGAASRLGAGLGFVGMMVMAVAAL